MSVFCLIIKRIKPPNLYRIWLLEFLDKLVNKALVFGDYLCRALHLWNIRKRGLIGCS